MNAIRAALKYVQLCTRSLHNEKNFSRSISQNRRVLPSPLLIIADEKRIPSTPSANLLIQVGKPSG